LIFIYLELQILTNKIKQKHKNDNFCNNKFI